MDIYSCVYSGAFSYYRLLTLEVGERGGDVRSLEYTNQIWVGLTIEPPGGGLWGSEPERWLHRFYHLFNVFNVFNICD